MAMTQAELELMESLAAISPMNPSAGRERPTERILQPGMPGAPQPMAPVDTRAAHPFTPEVSIPTTGISYGDPFKATLPSYSPSQEDLYGSLANEQEILEETTGGSMWDGLLGLISPDISPEQQGMLDNERKSLMLPTVLLPMKLFRISMSTTVSLIWSRIKQVLGMLNLLHLV